MTFLQFLKTIAVKGVWQYIFYFGLLIRTFEVTIMSMVKFLITWLVSEILKDEKKTLVIRHLGYSKRIHDVTAEYIRKSYS